MDRTTIEISKERKEQLREARLPYESNYDETIARLLNEGNVPYVTAERAREIANEQITDRVVSQAQE